MAIKSRLLSKLKFTYMTTTMAATAHPQKLRPVLHNLEEARELCQQGLTEGSYAKYGEVYDGLIMAVKQILSGEAGKDAGEIVGLCKELLEHIMAETSKEEHFKKEMVFLPYKASMWDSLESVWRAAYEDRDNCLAYVVPIPYCDRNPDGTAKEWHCERDLFPKDVPTLDWQEVDLKVMHPDVIFFHYPYDDCNRVTSVEEIFYSRNIKPCTDKLVYIPYFVLGEPKLDYDDPEKAEEVEEAEEKIAHFILEPGVFNADRTIVQSEAMKKVYVNVLTRHTNADREYWEEHILGLGSPKFDKVAGSRKEDFQLPEEWERVIKGRKTVLYNTGLTAMLEHTDKYLEKLKSVLDTFKAQQDVVLWWRPHPLLISTFESMHPELLEEYLEIVREYRQDGWGIYDDTAELERAVAWTDGYYGDRSSLVQLYEKTEKPIMLQTFDEEESSVVNMDVPYICCDDSSRSIWFIYSILGKKSMLYEMDIEEDLVKSHGELPNIDEKFIRYIVLERINNKIIIAPYTSCDVFIEYSLETHEFTTRKVIKSNAFNKLAFTNVAKVGGSLFFVGNASGLIVEYKSDEDEYICHREWLKTISDEISVENLLFQRAALVQQENVVFMPVLGTNKVIELNLKFMEAQVHCIPFDYSCSNISYNGRYFIITPHDDSYLVLWDKRKDDFEKIEIEADKRDSYVGSTCLGEHEVVLPYNSNKLLLINMEYKHLTDKNIIGDDEIEKHFSFVRNYEYESYAFNVFDGCLYEFNHKKSIVNTHEVRLSSFEERYMILKEILFDETQMYLENQPASVLFFLAYIKDAHKKAIDVKQESMYGKKLYYSLC